MSMTSAGTLFIGPLAISCHSEIEGPSPEPTGAYSRFYRAHDEGTPPDAKGTLHVTLRAGDTALPERPPDFASGRHWRFYQTDDGPLFVTGFEGRACAERLCRIAPDGVTAEIIVDPTVIASPDAPPRIRFPLAYPLDQILVWGMLSRARGFLLHAALVVDPDGNGLLFAGRSGAGKSTMSALCAEAGWTILNDDRALLYVEGNRIMAAGTPWHGSGRYAERRTVPVDGICFLAKAAEHRVETLDRDAAKAEWLQVAAVPWFLDAWANPTLDTLDHIMCKLPANRLHFAPDPTVVGVIPRRIHRGL